MSVIAKKVRPEEWGITQHVRTLEASIIREILKITSQPNVISFAGGLPAPEMFPITLLKRIAPEVLEKYQDVAVQYSLSRGIVPLREILAEMAEKQGISAKVENIFITSGAQQAIELIARAFIEPGDYILTENPTYLGALQAFNFYRARYATVEMDDDGMIVDKVEAQIKKYNPKLIYAISNFQNPTGVTMTLERRQRLVEIAAEYNIPIVDDDPYGGIRFMGEPVPAMKSFGGDGVMSLGTFSKLIAPGFRIGWINAPDAAVAYFEKVKQSADLHTSTLTQYIIFEFLKQGLLDEHIENIKENYRAKRELMIKTMEETFPEGVTWTHPEGGLFLWVKLPEHLSAKELLPKAVAQKVAYVYGEPFYANGGGANTMRLNFSNCTHEGIVEGITRLSKILKEAI
ncbi:MAG: aminotransferase [Candidatus Zixiibacteriota bacterium]|nr:MAG: aminotransferase [candidate division Zixibacteria bacterium]